MLDSSGAVGFTLAKQLAIRRRWCALTREAMYGLLYFKAESAKKSTFFCNNSEFSVTQFYNPKLAKYNPQLSMNMNRYTHQNESLRTPQDKNHISNLKFLHEKNQSFKRSEDEGKVVRYHPKGNIVHTKEEDIFDMATYLKDYYLDIESKEIEKQSI